MLKCVNIIHNYLKETNVDLWLYSGKIWQKQTERNGGGWSKMVAYRNIINSIDPEHQGRLPFAKEHDEVCHSETIFLSLSVQFLEFESAVSNTLITENMFATLLGYFLNRRTWLHYN